jgi:anti-sigma B factor antagonist
MDTPIGPPGPALDRRHADETEDESLSIASHRTSPQLELVVFDVPPECLVAAAGELDLATAPELDDTLRALDPSGELVTLDLRALTFMDVAGLCALLDARRYVRQTGRRMQILGPLHEAARVLELTGTRDLVS